MCRTLRDQTFLLVPLVACFLGRLAALTQIQDDAHHIRISDSSDGLDIPLPSAASENRDLAQHKQTAASLVASWGLTAPLALAQLAEPSANIKQLLASSTPYTSVVVILPGGAPPVRPSSNDKIPFLTLADEAHDGLKALPLQQINQAAATAARLLGYALYPLTLEVKSFNRTALTGPWVLYDVSAGRVCLDVRLLDNMHQLPVNMMEYTAEYASQTFSRLSAVPHATLQQAANTTVLGGIVSSAAAATAVAVTSQVPLWYCFACPIVLGLLFPLIFNLGCGDIADELCQYYSLPTEQCNELWYGAFALAMILSFASVLPIITMCKLAQCAKPSSPSLA